MRKITGLHRKYVSINSMNDCHSDISTVNNSDVAAEIVVAETLARNGKKGRTISRPEKKTSFNIF